MTALIKNMQLIATLDQLQTGDVVLFRSVYHQNLPQRLIGLYQSATSKKHGHYETVHAGICIGHDAKGPVIAHVTGGKIFGYAQESLIDTNIEDQESRSLIVYRHQDLVIRETIAARAAAIQDETNKPKWTFARAFQLPFMSNKKSAKNDVISESSICSKFTAEILQQATKNHESYLNVHSTITPKALEAELFKNSHYDLLIYTGNPVANSKQGINPYAALKQSIEVELTRLAQNKTDVSVQTKYTRVKKALFRAETFATKETDDLARAQHLLQEVMPELQKNTGWGINTPTSYKNVAAQARKLGMFRWNAPMPTTVSDNRLAPSPSTYGMRC